MHIYTAGRDAVPNEKSVRRLLDILHVLCHSKSRS